MRHNIFRTLWVGVFAVLGVFAINAQGITPLVEKCELPANALYRMFMKDYNDQIANFVAEKRRYVIRYTSSDPEIVLPWGNAFKTLKPGMTTVTMQVSQPIQGTADKFDPNAVMGECSFEVEVKDEVSLVMPPIDTPWGTSSEEAARLLIQKGATNFTESYWEMHPNVLEEYRTGVMVMLNSNVDFPISLLAVNSQDLLYRLTIVVSSWERVKMPKISAVYKWLLTQGFEEKGINPETNAWELYNPATKTLSTTGILFIQNAAYAYVDFLADNITGLDEIAGENRLEARVFQNGDRLEIRCDYQGTRPIEVYDAVGNKVAEQPLEHGVCLFQNLPAGLLLVRVPHVRPFKVLM